MLFPPDTLPTGPPVETNKALVLLDFQNDFLDPDGKLPVRNVPPFVPDLLALAQEFRQQGEVVWVGTEYKQPCSVTSPTSSTPAIVLKHLIDGPSPTDGNLVGRFDTVHESSPFDGPSPTPPRIPYGIRDDQAFLCHSVTKAKPRCCLPGSFGAQYPATVGAAIDPHRDLVLFKSGYSAFVDTDLLTHFRTRLITELYVCGSLSNISVYATVLDAVCHGLQVTLVEDCLGFLDEECHVEAMRQMADDMGASGIDCRELRDDLAGLLGDPIREADFTTKFQVTLAPSGAQGPATSRFHTGGHSFERRGLDVGDEKTRQRSGEPNRIDKNVPDSMDRHPKGESRHSPSHHLSPPRKRRIGDLEPLAQDRPVKHSHEPSTRPRSNMSASPGPCRAPKTIANPPSSDKRRSPATTSDAPTHLDKSETERAVKKRLNRDMALAQSDDDSSQDGVSPSRRGPTSRIGGARTKKMRVPTKLAPGDKIGEGDCRLLTEVLSHTDADAAFHECRSAIKWQKMFHRSGAVPRLVAVQGVMADDGQIPIYRHPADESPELLPFDSTVDKLRKAVESLVGHPLNHALIQWYRTGEDNISEHSDKSLDIVRGSYIVNMSLGAERTMTLRTKRSAAPAQDDGPGSSATRPSQRIALPHNSVFILGPDTNQHWLHAIRADKRRTSEKETAERDFGGERISLTFRHIGTFIDPNNMTIWGQGATAKARDDARPILSARQAEIEGEEMIRAFGQENHRSTDWDWDEWYGKGFDVVNFETKKLPALEPAA